jgi:probable 2-oxoglutarate dehydrogenase E1 component DHKTD1
LEEREWFANCFENLPSQVISDEERKELAQEMLKSQVVDKFLATKFVTLKRYGGEGAESMMAFFLQLFKLAALGKSYVIKYSIGKIWKR